MSDRRLRVFISGPLFNGDVLKNIERFTDIERELIELGFATINPGSVCQPHLALNRKQHDSVLMSRLDGCAIVFRVTGDSPMAAAQTQQAILSQIPVFHQLDKLKRWQKNGWLETATIRKTVDDYDIENDPEFLDKLTPGDIEELVENAEELALALASGPYTTRQSAIAWAGIVKFIQDNELSPREFCSVNDERSLFQCVVDTLQRWKNGHDEAVEHTADINAAVSKTDKREHLKVERGRVYGDARQNHHGIAQMWAPLLAPHATDIDALEPIPEWTVALMMAALKVARCRLVFHEDNYDDAANYLDFANAWQREDAENAFE